MYKYLLTFGACFLLACGGSDRSVAPHFALLANRLVVTSGADQEAEAGTELPTAIVVQVTDTTAGVETESLMSTTPEPVPGQIVNFVVTSGGGSVFAGSALTDENGEARERWTLGDQLGEQTLEARAVDPKTGAKIVYATITATAVPGPASYMYVETMTTPTTSTDVTVRVVDSEDRPIANDTLSFEATQGGGSVGDLPVVTDASGHATFTWSFGSTAEQHLVITYGDSKTREIFAIPTAP